MDYAVLSEIKTQLGIASTDTGRDAKLSLFIAAVTDLIDTYCGRNFLLNTITNETVYVPDRYTEKIFTKYFPIISVQSILENDVPLTENIHFFAYPGWIEKATYTPDFTAYWNSIPKKVVVSYTAGYASVPAAIKQVANEWVAILAMEKTKTFTTDEGIEKTVLLTSMPEYVKEILNMHRVPKAGICPL